MSHYIWYSEKGTWRGPSPPRSILAVQNVTAQPSTSSVPVTVLLHRVRQIKRGQCSFFRCSKARFREFLLLLAGEITVHLHTLRSIKIKCFSPEGANDFLSSSILAVLLTHNCTLKRFVMPPPRRGALSGHRRPSSVCLSDVAYIGSNSKTKRPRKTKLCTGVPQVTCDSHTDFKVKRSKVKVTGRGHIVAAT